MRQIAMVVILFVMLNSHKESIIHTKGVQC
jgi:hypothetical protein